MPIRTMDFENQGGGGGWGVGGRGLCVHLTSQMIQVMFRVLFLCVIFCFGNIDLLSLIW